MENTYICFLHDEKMGMKILAIDIGAGTQDILLFDSNKKIENCISLVLPTPSKIFSERLKKIKGDVYIHGDTVGGGSIGKAILRHLENGYRVIMDESAAYSIRNDLDEVRSMGIEVGRRPESDRFIELGIYEIDLKLLKDFLFHFGENMDVDVIAVAVQDHGVSPKGLSDRAFRFDQIEAMLRRNNQPESFHFLEESIPEYYLRMRSAVRAVRRDFSVPILVMDTSFSAILGCIDLVQGPSLIVNVGNGHTIAALLVEGKIQGIYEHHTHKLNPKKLESDLKLFLKGELKREKVFEEDGHGVITLVPFYGEVRVIVTGPNRDIFKGTTLNFIFASPGGNTMMTGPIGLVKASQYRFGTKSA